MDASQNIERKEDKMEPSQTEFHMTVVWSNGENSVCYVLNSKKKSKKSERERIQELYLFKMF